MNPVPIPVNWFDVWSIDFVTNLLIAADCNAVFTCIDKFIKYIYLTACFVGKRQLSAAECARLFFDIIMCMFGVLKAVLHNHNPCFTSNFWLALWDILQPKVLLMSAYHPQSDR